MVLLLVITTYPHHYQTQDVDLDDDSIRKDDDNATTACKSFNKQNEEILYELLRKTDTSTRVIKNCGTYTDNENTTNSTTTNNNNITNHLTNKVTITSESEKPTNNKTNIGKELTLSIDDYESINYEGIFNATSNSEKVNLNIENRNLDGPEQKEIDEAVEYGLKRMHDLYFVKEPELYRMGKCIIL